MQTPASFKTSVFFDATAQPRAVPLPWSLRAWSPVLWQADRCARLRLQHLGTRITGGGASDIGMAGQTLWGAHSGGGEAGLAWDWIEIGRGIVAMADPMAVVTNLRFIGDEGEVLTALEAARFLNAIVHQLPWQTEVARALKSPAQTQ